VKVKREGPPVSSWMLRSPVCPATTSKKKRGEKRTTVGVPLRKDLPLMLFSAHKKRGEMKSEKGKEERFPDRQSFEI